MSLTTLLPHKDNVKVDKPADIGLGELVKQLSDSPASSSLQFLPQGQEIVDRQEVFAEIAASKTLRSVPRSQLRNSNVRQQIIEEDNYYASLLHDAQQVVDTYDALTVSLEGVTSSLLTGLQTDLANITVPDWSKDESPVAFLRRVAQSKNDASPHTVRYRSTPQNEGYSRSSRFNTVVHSTLGVERERKTYRSVDFSSGFGPKSISEKIESLLYGKLRLLSGKYLARVTVSTDEAIMKDSTIEVAYFGTHWAKTISSIFTGKPAFKPKLIRKKVPVPEEHGKSWARSVHKDAHEAAYQQELATLLPRKYEVRSKDSLESNLDNATDEIAFLADVARYVERASDLGYAITMQPTISGGEERFIASGMISPLLATKKEVVSNDAYLTDEKRMISINGPNNNGKTTYTTGIALNVVLAQNGLPAFGNRVTFRPTDGIYTIVIDPSEMHTGKSRHAQNLQRTRHVVQKITPDSIVLMDEPYSGTDHEAGRNRYVETFEVLSAARVTALSSTHFSGIPDIEGLKTMHSVYSNEYTYQIAPGESSRSNEANVAQQVGADKDSLTAIVEQKQG